MRLCPLVWYQPRLPSGCQRCIAFPVRARSVDRLRSAPHAVVLFGRSETLTWKTCHMPEAAETSHVQVQHNSNDPICTLALTRCASGSGSVRDSVDCRNKSEKPSKRARGENEARGRFAVRDEVTQTRSASCWLASRFPLWRRGASSRLSKTRPPARPGALMLRLSGDTRLAQWSET